MTYTGKLGCTVANTPIELNHQLSYALEDRTIDKSFYQMLVGRLIYLSHIKLDMAYVVSIVSQFMHNPKKVYLRAVHKILQYLKKYTGRRNPIQKKARINTYSLYRSRLCWVSD